MGAREDEEEGERDRRGRKKGRCERGRERVSEDRKRFGERE